MGYANSKLMTRNKAVTGREVHSTARSLKIAASMITNALSRNRKASLLNQPLLFAESATQDMLKARACLLSAAESARNATSKYEWDIA